MMHKMIQAYTYYIMHKQKEKSQGGRGGYSTSWNSVPAPPAQRKMGGELYLFCGWSVLELKLFAYIYRIYKQERVDTNQ
jgi:hypothetical protein